MRTLQRDFGFGGFWGGNIPPSPELLETCLHTICRGCLLQNVFVVKQKRRSTKSMCICGSCGALVLGFVEAKFSFNLLPLSTPSPLHLHPHSTHPTYPLHPHTHIQHRRNSTSTSMAAARRRVVVTGIGIVSPLGVGTKATWDALLAGRIGVRGLDAEKDNIPKLADMPARIAAPVDQSLIVPPPGEEGNWSRLSPFIRYAMLAAEEALHHAQWHPSTSSEKERSGVYIGTGIGCLDEIVEAHRVIHSGGGVRRLSPHFVPKILGNLATGNVSIRHGLQGPNHASITACASGAHAVGDAFRMIQFGDADVMVAGGTEACINAISLGGFSRLRALSTKYNDEPHRASRPFDSGRDGFVMGEGAAVLVLEEREHARARGAKPLAEVIGYGMAGDAHHITAPSPDGGGAFRAMRAALKNANVAGRRGEGGREGVRMGEVDYVNAHATSTPVGDTIEGNAMQRLLETHRKEDEEGKEEQGKKTKYVSSTKGATGHLLGAAGALEAAFTVLALRDGVVPGTANLDSPDPAAKEWDFELVGQQQQQGGMALPEMDLALSNSFGFGGVNVSLLFRRCT